MDETLKELGAYIATARGAAVAEWHVATHELTVTIPADEIVSFVTFIRDDPRLGFINLTDVCGVDWPAREKRFDVV